MDETETCGVATAPPAQVRTVVRPSEEGTAAHGWSAAATTLLTSIATELAGLATLTVLGGAMSDACLSDGDVVLYQHEANVRDGELAVVRIAGRPELALRRVFVEDGLVWLSSQDRASPPQCLDRSAVRIRGRVIAVARRPSGDVGRPATALG